MVTKAIVLVGSIVVFSSAAQDDVRPFSLNDLTVPWERLPEGCALWREPSTGRQGDVMHGGLSVGLRVPTNPWAGTDTSLIASIRERMAPPPVPDAPPMSSREAARFRIQLANNIEEGYAATYHQAESKALVVVHGLRFARATDAQNLWHGLGLPTSDPVAVRVQFGPIAAVVSGDPGDCLDRVGAYVKSLVQK